MKPAAKPAFQTTSEHKRAFKLGREDALHKFGFKPPAYDKPDLRMAYSLGYDRGTAELRR